MQSRSVHVGVRGRAMVGWYRAIAAASCVALVLVAGTGLVKAQGTTQVAGTSFYETPNGPDLCPDPPSGFDSYPPLVLSGDLHGCWYTKVETSKVSRSGAYLESGQETFVGTLNGGAVGTFTTTYRFEAKLAPDGAEIRGRCQHWIVSTTGGFAGATGVIQFKDAPPQYFYRGHITTGA
jgi:hypothetical protein